MTLVFVVSLVLFKNGTEHDSLLGWQENKGALELKVRADIFVLRGKLPKSK